MLIMGLLTATDPELTLPTWGEIVLVIFLPQLPENIFPRLAKIILLVLPKSLKIIQLLPSSQKYSGMLPKMFLRVFMFIFFFPSAKHKLQK